MQTSMRHDNQAEIWATDARGRTALQLAVEFERWDAAALLLQAARGELAFSMRKRLYF